MPNCSRTAVPGWVRLRGHHDVAPARDARECLNAISRIVSQGVCKVPRATSVQTPVQTWSAVYKAGPLAVEGAVPRGLCAVPRDPRYGFGQGSTAAMLWEPSHTLCRSLRKELRLFERRQCSGRWRSNVCLAAWDELIGDLRGFEASGALGQSVLHSSSTREEALQCALSYCSRTP